MFQRKFRIIEETTREPEGFVTKFAIQEKFLWWWFYSKGDGGKFTSDTFEDAKNLCDYWSDTSGTVRNKIHEL
jgi:hypothetical protein